MGQSGYSKNLICKLFGCILDEQGNYCIRCGLPLYEEDAGILWPIMHIFRDFRDKLWGIFWNKIPYRKCDCGKWIRKPSYFCSKKCEENYIPF